MAYHHSQDKDRIQKCVFVLTNERGYFTPAEQFELFIRLDYNILPIQYEISNRKLLI